MKPYLKLLLTGFLLTSSTACRSTLATCLDFCSKVQECGNKGCSCSIDRCDNEGDVADALDACLDVSCDEYFQCANKAVASCEL